MDVTVLLTVDVVVTVELTEVLAESDDVGEEVVVFETEDVWDPMALDEALRVIVEVLVGVTEREIVAVSVGVTLDVREVVVVRVTVVDADTVRVELELPVVEELFVLLTDVRAEPEVDGDPVEEREIVDVLV